MLHKYKYILWGFDGVIINSDSARIEGFVVALNAFPKEQVDQLLEFHRQNGGLSRYVKFRYFFEKIRNESVDDKTILKYAETFSSLMKNVLKDKLRYVQNRSNWVKKSEHKQFIQNEIDQLWQLMLQTV